MRKVLSIHDYQGLKKLFEADYQSVDEYLVYNFEYKGKCYSALIVFPDDFDEYDRKHSRYYDMEDTEIEFLDIIPIIKENDGYRWDINSTIQNHLILERVLNQLIKKANDKLRAA